MSTVRRVSTFVQEQEIDDGEGFSPLVAIGIARGAGEWRTVRNDIVYEVTEGEHSYQVAVVVGVGDGDVGPEEVAAGRGGEVPAAAVALADADALGAAASEAEGV